MGRIIGGVVKYFDRWCGSFYRAVWIYSSKRF